MNFFHQYDALLSADEKALVDRTREFCSGAFSDETIEAHHRNEPLPLTWSANWAATGMLGLQARRTHGGLEASYACKIRVAQEMARVSFANAFCLNHHQGNVTRMSNTGSPEQIERLLPAALSGEILWTTAMTEPGGGSDVGALATKATKVEGGYLIEGAKAWMTDGLAVGGLVMLARVPDAAGGNEIGSFYVLLDDPKTYSRDELMVPGGRAFRLATITLRDHFVPEWCLAAAPGKALKTAMGAVNGARVHVAAMAVASLQAALAETIGYAGTRRTFGKSLLHHQGLRWELAEVSVRLEAANALVFRAVEQIHGGGNPVELAAQAKKFAIDTAIWGIDQCVRAVGATGASAAYRLNMHASEVRMAAYADGTNEMLIDRIGRSLSALYPYERQESSCATL